MDIQWQRAWALVKQTSNYVWYRAMVHGALCLGVIAYWVVLSIVGMVFGPGAFWVLFVSSGIFGTMIGFGGFVGEALFYRQRAGHIALITELLTEGKLPEAISQVKWAQGRVRHYFGMTMLPQVRAGLRDAIGAVNVSVFDSAEALPTSVLPVPGIEGGTKLAQHLVSFSQGYIEDAAIAHAFKTKNENVLDATRTAVLLYCQCWKPVLTNAVTLTLVGYVFMLAASIVFLIPLGLLAQYAVPNADPDVRFVLFAVGVFLGISAKWVLYDPVASALTILTFLEEADLVTVDESWDETLETASPAYALLKKKAKGEVSAVKRAARRPRAKKAVREEIREEVREETLQEATEETHEETREAE